MTLTDMLSVDRPKKSTRLLQDGVKFRTICASCNNAKLGHRYDPSLIAFANDVRQLLLNQAGLILPPQMTLLAKPNRLARAIVGHLLAHGLDQPKKGSVVAALSEYFLNEEISFPEGVQLYYWLYPYPDHVALKGFAFSTHLWKGMTAGMLLKFFPLAFLFVTDQPHTENRILSRLDRLDRELRGDIDYEARLIVRFRDLPYRRWPECPTDATMVLHGDGALAAVAVPRAI